jgi:hypothetical protein
MFRDYAARSGAIIAKPLSNRKTSRNFFGFEVRESFRLQSIRGDGLVQSNGLAGGGPPFIEGMPRSARRV